MTDRSLSIDVAAIRERARANMADGAVTISYGQDQRQVATELNDALATEVVRWLRYTRHAVSATDRHLHLPGDHPVARGRRHHDETADGVYPKEEERHANDILDLLGSLDGGSRQESSRNP